MYQNLKLYHRRPSEDLAEPDKLAAWCADNAVVTFGVIVENALQERRNTGTKDKPKWEPMYSLHQLLDSGFVLPEPPKPKRGDPLQQGFAQLLAMAKQPRSGVKLWKAS